MSHAGHGGSLNQVALMAMLHCLTGCAIGEVLGMIIGTALGWSNVATIVLAIALAFTFGHAFTMIPLLRSGMAARRAMDLAFASDTRVDHRHGDRRQRGAAADPRRDGRAPQQPVGHAVVQPTTVLLTGARPRRSRPQGS